jgi:uncharacterized protein (DUF433 family)
VYRLRGCGPILVTNRTYRELGAEVAIRVGDWIELRSSTAEPMQARVAGIEHLDPWSRDHHLTILLSNEVAHERVEVGAEIRHVEPDLCTLRYDEVPLESPGVPRDASVSEAPTMTTRIEVNARIRFGKPCVAGTRITVQEVLELIREEVSYERIVSDYYPDLTREDIRACLQYAIDAVSFEDLHVSAPS